VSSHSRARDPFHLSITLVASKAVTMIGRVTRSWQVQPALLACSQSSRPDLNARSYRHWRLRLAGAWLRLALAALVSHAAMMGRDICRRAERLLKHLRLLLRFAAPGSIIISSSCLGYDV
jgi:hypothetical protein